MILVFVQSQMINAISIFVSLQLFICHLKHDFRFTIKFSCHLFETSCFLNLYKFDKLYLNTEIIREGVQLVL